MNLNVPIKVLGSTSQLSAIGVHAGVGGGEVGKAMDRCTVFAAQVTEVAVLTLKHAVDQTGAKKSMHDGSRTIAP